MAAYVPIVFAILGILMYFIAKDGKVQEIGRLLFATSWLALMIAFAQKTVTLMR